MQSGRYRADDRPSHSVDADSAASGSASQAQHRGFTFGRLLNKPTMPLQLSRQRTEADEAETPTSAWNPPGKPGSEDCQAPVWAADLIAIATPCAKACHQDAAKSGSRTGHSVPLPSAQLESPTRRLRQSSREQRGSSAHLWDSIYPCRALLLQYFC